MARHQHRPMQRLTQPLVRRDGVLQPATWDEALDPRRRGVPSQSRSARRHLDRRVLVLEIDQRDELRGPEAGAHGVRHQQHRFLQPNLTRSLRGRSGHSVRSRRRHVVVSGGRGRRRDRDVGVERPQRPPDLLPPRAQGDPQGRQAVLGRPAPHRDRPVRRPLARPARRYRHRPVEHDRPRDHPCRPGQHELRRARHQRVRRVRRIGRTVDARTRVAGHRGPGRRDP